MELINATRMTAGYTMGTEPSGRESLVVVIKGTFRLPRAGEAVSLHEQQLPLVMADTFTGAPGFSAPMHEVDFAPCKPRCEVLLLGSAHAPGGRAAARVPVGLRVGGMIKRFDVVGDRYWQAGATRIAPSTPQPFLRKAISYDVAFGGVDQRHDDPDQHGAYTQNPVGRGYHKHLTQEWVDGQPLPNTEEESQPVTRPDGTYRPQAFGPIGRGWDARRHFAGTYDDQWLTEQFPFLPQDFDEQYYQAAPRDQQLAAPAGGTEVAMLNLTPDGIRQFTLPAFEAPVHVFPKRGEREDLNAVLDTVVFEPDAEQFSISWRVRRPLRRNMFEIEQILVGKRGTEWWQRREEVVFPVRVERLARL